MLSRSKLKIIQSLTSKALINNEISYKDFTVIVSEKRNYRHLKETIKMMKSQKSKIERGKLTEDGKIKSINRQNKTVKYQL